MENPISRTAYYTLGVRAWDAQQVRPLAGDRLAPLLMNEEAARIWAEFQHFHLPNTGNAIRHALMDHHLVAELGADRRMRVIVLGAGFDTRAFRLPGGEWIEVDEPAVLEYKDARLPASRCPNRLVRVPVVFARESLAEKLKPWAGSARTHVVVEGVWMYLADGQRRGVLQTLRELFPHHVVYCDLMRRSFFETYARSIYEKVESLGARFVDMVEEPEALFLEQGYRATACTSITLTSSELGAVKIPAFVVRWFLGRLRRGFLVWKFEHGGA